MKPRPLLAGLAPDVEFDDEELGLALSAELADVDEELLLPVTLAEELWAEDSEADDEAALDAVAEA